MTEYTSRQMSEIIGALGELRRRWRGLPYQEAVPRWLCRVLPEYGLEVWEGRQKVRLPEGYRIFITALGNGGPGPYGGLRGVDLEGEEQIRLLPGSGGQGNRILVIGSIHDEKIIGLGLDGEVSGKVCYWEVEKEQEPFFPEYPDFLSWYHSWLHETLSGYWTGNFGYAVLGGAEAVLRRCEEETEADRLPQILGSFYKYRELSSDEGTRLEALLKRPWGLYEKKMLLEFAARFHTQNMEQILKEHLAARELIPHIIYLIAEYDRDQVETWFMPLKECLSLLDEREQEQEVAIYRAFSVLEGDRRFDSSIVEPYLGSPSEKIRSYMKEICCRHKSDRGFAECLYQKQDLRDVRRRMSAGSDRLSYYLHKSLLGKGIGQITIEELQKIRKLTCTEAIAPSRLMGIDYSFMGDIEILAYAVHLNSLDLNGCRQIRSMEPLRQCRELKRLILKDTALESIGFLEDLIKLRILDVSQNRISSLEPLRKLNGLVELSLWDNPISDFSPLFHMEQLRLLVDERQMAEIKQLAIPQGWTVQVRYAGPQGGGEVPGPGSMGCMLLKQLGWNEERRVHTDRLADQLSAAFSEQLSSESDAAGKMLSTFLSSFGGLGGNIRLPMVGLSEYLMEIDILSEEDGSDEFMRIHHVPGRWMEAERGGAENLAHWREFINREKEPCVIVGRMGYRNVGTLLLGASGYLYLQHQGLPWALRAASLPEMIEEECKMAAAMNPEKYLSMGGQTTRRVEACKAEPEENENNAVQSQAFTPEEIPWQPQTSLSWEAAVWIHSRLFYSGFQRVWSSAIPASMRVIYQTRILSLLKACVEQGVKTLEPETDDESTAAVECSPNSICFYEEGNPKARMNEQEFKAMMEYYVHLFWKKYFHISTQKKVYTELLDQIATTENEND